MKRALAVVGGLLWFGLVFFVTWRVTFPSQAVSDRVAVEVDRATGGEYQLSMSDVRPWWSGIAANNVILYEVERGRGDEAGEKSPLFAFEAAWVRAGLFSLLRNQPRVIGAVEIAGSDLAFDVTAGMNKRGTQLVPRVVNVNTSGFPVQDLAGMMGTELEATGGIDLDVRVQAEEGMRDANGDIRIGGRNILITSLDPSLTGGMDLGMEIPIDTIDIHFEVEDGKATVRTGKVESKLVDAEISGDITLREEFDRSSIDIGFALELGEELEMFKNFLKRAQWDDGTFHYRCSGTFSRPNCREDPQRGSARVSGGRTNAGDSAAGGARRSRSTESTPRSTLSDEEREQRRQEALERLRKNRERRAGTAGTAAGGDDPERGGSVDGTDPDEELEEIGYAEDDEEAPAYNEEDFVPDEEAAPEDPNEPWPWPE